MVAARLKIASLVMLGAMVSGAEAGGAAEMPVPERIDNALTYPMLTEGEFVAREGDVAEMREIKGRLYRHYLSVGMGRAVDAEGGVEGLMGRMTAEGAWPDLDYGVRAKMFFPQMPHLQRLTAMAVAYRNPKHPKFGSVELKEAIRRGLAHWCRTNPKTDHHWYIEIGAPMELLYALVLMESELTKEEIAAALPLLRASYREGLFRFGPREATGQNMMWVARMNLEAGLLEENAFAVARATRRFGQEIKVTELEGVQPDWSFTQHGHQLYAAGYGSGYAADATQVALYLAGTRFALEPGKIEIIANYVLEGQQWMMRGKHWISGPRGRELSRRLPGPATLVMPQSVAERLAALLPARAEELRTAGQRMRGAVPPSESALVGNRHFWRVDLMCHHRTGWMAAVRMASDRVIGTESGNLENLLGHHLADGVMEVLVSGEEYRGVWPLWNWRQLPGTTVAQVEGALPEHQWGKGAKGTTAFVGGVSDGVVGAAAMTFDRDGVRAEKAWFFLDDQVVALATGVGSSADAVVLTTVNQCWKKGDVWVSVAGSPASKAKMGGEGEEMRFTGPGWVWHDGVGYVVEEGQEAVLRLEQREGSWYTINQTQSKDVVKGDVFTLAIDHGVKPDGAKYAYRVIPGVTVEAMSAGGGVAEVRALQQGRVQGIEVPGREMVMAVFPERAGGVLVGEGLKVSADRDCVVIVGPAGVTVSDPTARGGEVRLTVERGAKVREFRVKLPEGAMGGSGVKVAG